MKRSCEAAARTAIASIARMAKHPIVGSWLLSLFLFVPIYEWVDAIVLFLCFLIVPAIALVVWLVAVPLLIVKTTLIELWRKRWVEAFVCLAILPIGVVVGLLALQSGDLIAVMFYGPGLKAAVEATRDGAPPRASNGMFSSSTMAFEPTGGWLDLTEGVAYDETGLAELMMPLRPSERPPEWQKNAVDVMICRGYARRLIGKFYKITVSTSAGC